MAASSLNNMSVQATPGDNQGLLMPKLQYRFRVLFDNFGLGSGVTEMTKQVIDVTRPNVEFPEIALPVYNSTIYLAGKPTWQAISVNLRDDVNASIQTLVGQQIQKQFDFQEQASAAAGGDYKFQMRVQVLDGGNGILTPNVLETWALYGCYIASANYNSMNYGTNDPVTVSLSVRYDNATQYKGNSDGTGATANGIGTALGRAFGSSVVTGVGQQ